MNIIFTNNLDMRLNFRYKFIDRDTVTIEFVPNNWTSIQIAAGARATIKVGRVAAMLVDLEPKP